MNVLARDKEQWVETLLESRLSRHEASRTTGVHKNTVARIARDLELFGVQLTCKCGLPSNHKGWCEWRFNRSVARQEFMDRWRTNRMTQHPLGTIYTRQDTYRNPEKARRSFYKWVCKNEFYGVARMASDKWGTYIYRVSAKYTFGYAFTRGYPAYEAPRSECRKRWENIFDKRKEEILKAINEKRQERSERMELARVVSNPKTTKFFRLLGALKAA